MIPATGVKNIPGKVKALISNPICVLLRFNVSEIFGKAGVILATPITAIMVMPNIVHNRLSLNTSLLISLNI